MTLLYLFDTCFWLTSKCEKQKKILILFVSHKIAVTNKTLWFDPSADIIYTSISQKKILISFDVDG